MMSHKARLYELMMKREKLAMRQKSDVLMGLVEDRTRLADLDSQLSELLAESTKKSGPLSVSALRSKAFYGREMAQQREFAVNRLDFLAVEIETAQAKLSQAKQKEKILAERAVSERRAFANEIDEKAERLRNLRRPVQKM
ncbi:hypothetical protein NIG5292_02183 [Nereida ignava]|uniref:Flagellar FliJ protein n=3 Tax=Nereida ignava TaxID=282199 RepID=A0A0U1NN20_9RHOB|nr:hypothetical protein NIG5292_02183 [Nereida ignava]SFJ56696.1 hypothetical protein SAMN02745667_01648 [Nereida ignava DSM 16309]